MEDLYTSLLSHFETEAAEGKFEFRLKTTKTENGFEILIHPMGKDGKTLDLRLERHTSSYVTLT